MVFVLNPLFLSCCKIVKREAGKFERACGLNALASVKWVPWFLVTKKLHLDLIDIHSAPENIHSAMQASMLLYYLLKERKHIPKQLLRPSSNFYYAAIVMMPIEIPKPVYARRRNWLPLLSNTVSISLC